MKLSLKGGNIIMEKELTEFEIRKRLRIIFLIAFFFTLLLAILFIAIGFAHSWEMNNKRGIVFICTVIWSFTHIWLSAMRAIPSCFQNLPIKEKEQQRFKIIGIDISEIDVLDIVFIVIYGILILLGILSNS